MINWEVVRIVFYASLVIGAPLCFFYFVDDAKEEDQNTAQNALDLVVSERMKTVSQELEDEKKKLKEVLDEKDAIIKAREAELAKMRPLLKYVRTAPTARQDAEQSTSDVSPTVPDFGDDTV